MPYGYDVPIGVGVLNMLYEAFKRVDLGVAESY